jgi:type IV secretion system protein VirB11
MISVAALDSFLLPLKQILDKEGVTEISINRPNEVWIEIAGDMYRQDLPGFDVEHLKSLARLVAQSTEQRVSEEEPLLSATLPNVPMEAISKHPSLANNSATPTLRTQHLSWSSNR